VTELQDRISAVQEELQTLLRSVGGLQVILPELHGEATGRIDASELAGGHEFKDIRGYEHRLDLQGRPGH
jgi:hypothetical protein